jgi:hypothetical protein
MRHIFPWHDEQAMCKTEAEKDEEKEKEEEEELTYKEIDR